MTEYDSMSVHELVTQLFYAERLATLALVESALRRAVVREASVGVVKLSHNGVASDYDIVPHKETP